MNITENEYLNYFGQKFDYYKSQIDSNYIKKWNWAIFFLGPFWLIYRNLYFPFFIFSFLNLSLYILHKQLEITGLYVFPVKL